MTPASLRVAYGSFNELALRGMADLKLSDTLAFRVSGMSRGRDGYVGMIDYGQSHPGSNVPQNTTRGRGNSDYATMGGQNILAGRAALRWTPSDELDVNVSYDYTRERSEAISDGAHRRGCGCARWHRLQSLFRRCFELRR